MPCRVYEYVELYLYYRYTPSWRVRGKLYFLPSFIHNYPRVSFAAMNFCMIQQQRSALQLVGTLYEFRPGHRGFSQ